METSIQDLTLDEAINYLNEVDEKETANELKKLANEDPALRKKRLSEIDETYDLPGAKWRGTEHTYGYIKQGTGDFLDIIPANLIDPDKSLRGKRINIKLGSLCTMNYPGGGTYNVLMNFKCKHASEDNKDTITIEFQQKFKSKEGESAGNVGSFVFLGIRIPNDGLQFEVQTINVSNDGDDAALQVLETDPI